MCKELKFQITKMKADPALIHIKRYFHSLLNCNILVTDFLELWRMTFIMF